MWLSILMLSAGCAGSLFMNYGKISPNMEVTNAFETYQINTEYNYYISGSDVYPNAIIGLDKGYTLESDLWKEVEMTPKRLRELVTDMKDKATTVNYGMPLYGFAMLDDKGNQIGVWYSILEAKTFLKMKDNRTVIIYTPDIDTYDKYDHNRFAPGTP
jgi:fructose 1,6-bisphosphatase